ncbi:MAG: nitronate monooxygenase family protein [Candidatus Kaelpia imicola]|nr:nitronate monooxygenase family protein [Candidatus Kaelpia imicola]
MEFKGLNIGDLKIEIPIIQGGMGVRVSNYSLVSAVSNEGALGVIAAVGLGETVDCSESDYKKRSSEALRESIRETKKRTDKPFGVNIMCALSNYDELVAVAEEEKVDVIITGAGLSMKLPSLVKNPRTKLLPIVSSGRAARIICANWKRKFNRLPDAVVVEGPLAGGHLGFSRAELDDPQHFYLDKILVDVIEVVKGFQADQHKIPVIAAGGIFDGKDIARVMKLGASGVQMATRFVCTHECDVSPKYKEMYINAKEEGIVIIQSPVGLPGRVIRNDFVTRIMQGERIDFECAYQCLSTCNPKKVNYCIGKALINASRGRMDKGFAMCGSNAYRINKIISVKELINELVKEARKSYVL